jgi:hypothetical protein
MVVAMKEWQRLVVQIGEVRAELESRSAHVARLCAYSAQLAEQARQRIAESEELLLKLSGSNERTPG